MIKHNSSKPLYLQIKENIEEKVRMGKYSVGSKLPSENELCKHFSVSRITIRQALDLLENEGMTHSIHGKGTFVKANIIDSNLNKINSFGATLARMGYSGYTKITHYEERDTDDFEQMLHGKDWSRVSNLCLTGFSMDEPVVIYRSLIKSPYGADMYKLAKELETSGIAFSTYDLYARLGLEIGKVDQKVEAINADEKTAELLHKNPGDAILVLDSIVFDKNMKPVEYKKGYYCTDKYSFTLNREL